MSDPQRRYGLQPSRLLHPWDFPGKSTGVGCHSLLWKWLSCVQLFVSPWTILSTNSPGQNTGVGSLSLLQGIFQTQGSNPGFLYCWRFLYQLSHKGSPRILEWVAIPSPVDLPDPGIKLGSPALQADSLPTELSRKPIYFIGKKKKKKPNVDRLLWARYIVCIWPVFS